ncbi:MAG TPA: phospholipase [Micromonosporaceae bacterium]|nr:phospholipase [Micromonosporaceae bacterium]HCU50941.1 phospholipase [Micromonosporaceae bacterium]
MRTAVEFWLAAEGGGAGKPRWVRLGKARPSGERGWFSVDLRGSRSDAEQLGALRFAGGDDPDKGACTPLEVVQEGQILRVRVPEFVDPAERFLWLHRQPPTYLLTRLRDEIAAMSDPGLAHDLAMGHLAGPPSVLPDIAGFTAEQREAYASCFAPGVRLVWGPPGTGKTRVLTEAISDLVASRKRVLLVSSTNIAVDNALAGVVRHRSHRTGDLVRVGPPHLREVAANPDIALAHLTSKRLLDVEERRLNLQRRLLALRLNVERLAAAEEKIQGFDLGKYERILAMIIVSAEIPSIANRLATARRCTADLSQSLSRSQASLAAAERDWAGSAQDRSIFARIESLQNEVLETESSVDRIGVQLLIAREKLDQAEMAFTATQLQPLLKRLTSLRASRTAKSTLDDERQRVSDLEARQRQAKELLARFRASSDLEIRRLAESVALSREEISARAQAVKASRATFEERQAAHQQAAAEEKTLQSALLAAEANPRASNEEVSLVDNADQLGLPDRYAEMLVLRHQVAIEARQREQLEKQHADVQEEFDKLRKDAEGEIIREARVVATTLARLRTNKALLEGPYDVVLVDEVGAATIPEVLLAVSRAKQSAVLLGDFMQLGAVLPTKVAKEDRPDVKRWLRTDVFGLCGITTANDAYIHHGCTMLDTQHRFGPEVMSLANEIAYDGLLKPGQGIHPRDPREDPEIVLINTDGLDDLSLVHATGAMKGWWPAGALLSRVIAEYHQARGEDVGVVTPYADQTDATLEAMRDLEKSDALSTEVGTAHRFQGREFSVVIFDLVEDSYDDRWMAIAHNGTTPYARDGLRLFNVALTRTKTRLYLIGSRAKIARAKPGTPLSRVAVRLGTRIRTVRAETLISATVANHQASPELGPFGRDLADILAQHVRVADIEGERQFYTELSAHLDSAQKTIWIWAAWTTNRMKTVLPLLSDAVARGVKITVFVRDPSDGIQGRPDSQAFMTALRATVQKVIEVHKLHQKIIVIDEHTVLFGSLNALSQHQSREVMLVMEGSHFARKLLEHERAEDLSQPMPSCGQCGGSSLDLRRKSNGDWYWRCYTPTKVIPPGKSKAPACGWKQTIPMGRRTGT